MVCFIGVVNIMGFYKSTLVARGANTQLDPSCVSAPPAINLDLFPCLLNVCLYHPQLTIYRAGA